MLNSFKHDSKTQFKLELFAAKIYDEPKSRITNTGINKYEFLFFLETAKTEKNPKGIIYICRAFKINCVSEYPGLNTNEETPFRGIFKKVSQV